MATQTKGKSLDLSEGPILSRLVAFAAPILLGQLFQTLYNSVDSIVIGNFVSDDPVVCTNALAAVTASASIANFLVGFFVGLSTGASVLFSRSFGGKDYDTLDQAIHTTLLFSVIFGAIVAVLGAILTPTLLSLVSCPPEVMADAIIYLRIYMIGALCLAMYNVAAGVLRSIGDSQAPFRYLVLASCMNIVLDIAFVAVLKMGVAGVAIATVISQMTSVLLSCRRMMGMDERYAFRFDKLKINGGLLKQVMVLGLPAAIQSSITGLSNMYLQRYMNSFSPAVISGIGSGMKIDQFAGMPCNALGLAMTTFIGQNMGANKPERARQGTRMVVLAVTVYVAAVSVPVFLLADKVVGLFGKDPTMISYGAGFLHTIMPVYLIMGFQMLFGGIIRGYGYSIQTMCFSVFGMVAMRQLWLAVSMSIERKVSNIYLGYPIGWACVLIPMLVFYFWKIRPQISLKNISESNT